MIIMMTVRTILIKMLVGHRWRWVKGKQLVMFCWHQHCTCTLGREKSPQIFNQFRDTTWSQVFWVGAEYILETNELYVHGHHPRKYMHWIENELACILFISILWEIKCKVTWKQVGGGGEEKAEQKKGQTDKKGQVYKSYNVYKWCDVSYILRNKIINDNIGKLKWGDVLYIDDVILKRIDGSQNWCHWDWDLLKIFLRGIVHLEVGCSMGPKIKAFNTLYFYFFCWDLFPCPLFLLLLFIVYCYFKLQHWPKISVFKLKLWN